MRPVRIITAVVFAAAVAVTGCAAHSSAVNPPVTPVVEAPAPPAPSPAPTPIPVPVPVPAPKAPVLADGHYDAGSRFLMRAAPAGSWWTWCRSWTARRPETQPSPMA